MKNVALLFILFLFGCKTSKNGYSRIVVERYNLEELRNKYLNSTSFLDTIIVLKLSKDNLKTPIENNLFVFKKTNDSTKIERVSNFRKYMPITLSNSSIEWNNTIEHIDLYIKDKIKVSEEVVIGNRIITFQGRPEGNTHDLSIYFGNVRHRAFLGPSVDSFNLNNINLSLINKLTLVTEGISWTPTEKLKYRKRRVKPNKWERPVKVKYKKRRSLHPKVSRRKSRIYYTD